MVSTLWDGRWRSNRKRKILWWTMQVLSLSFLATPCCSRLHRPGLGGCRWGCKHLAANRVAEQLSIQTVGNLLLKDMLPVNRTLLASINGTLRSPCWTSAIDGAHTCLPGLLVVGLPKCGTTDFAAKIGYHPLLQMSKHKEPHFWTRCNRPKNNLHTCPLPDNPSTANMTASFHDYLKQWNSKAIVQTSALAYEASASTFWELRPFKDHGVNLTTPELIRASYGEFAKQIKIIVLFRDPSARSWSDYTYFSASHRYKASLLAERNGKVGKHPLPPRPNQDSYHTNVNVAIAQYRKCFAERSVDACATDATFTKGETALQNGRLGIGLYEPMLRAWSAHFGPDQLLALRAETLWSNAIQEFEKVFEFLDLPPMSLEMQDQVAALDPHNSQKKGALQGKSLVYKDHLSVDEHMRNDTHELLRVFFEPFEANLKVMLEKMHNDRLKLRSHHRIAAKGEALVSRYLHLNGQS